MFPGETDCPLRELQEWPSLGECSAGQTTGSGPQTTKNCWLSQGWTDSMRAQRDSSTKMRRQCVYSKNYNCQADQITRFLCFLAESASRSKHDRRLNHSLKLAW